MQKEHKAKTIKRAFIIAFIALFCFGFYKAFLEEYTAKSVFATARGRVIVIDPGHGAFDVGAVGTTTKVQEKNINLQVALKLKDFFENAGATVIMTRENDKAIAYNKDSDMYKRRMIIKESNADIVISIHMNRFVGSSSVSGPQVYYCKGSVNGEKAATYVQAQLIKKLNPSKKRKAAIGDYYILKSGASPCILVECGFLSNPREERLLQQSSYQDKIASAIFAGVEQYFNEIPKVTFTPLPTEKINSIKPTQGSMLYEIIE